MRRISAWGTLLLLMGSTFALGQTDTNLQVSEYDGGSVALRTAIGFLNQDSTLKRTWYVIDDTSSPVRLDRAGVATRLDEKEKIQYFVPLGTLAPKQAISAVEVRYLLFNIWGERLRTLSLTRLADSSTHVDLRFSSNNWPALELEASQLVTVVAFVARVRMADGQQWTYDPRDMTARIQSLGVSVGASDLSDDEQRIVNPALVYLMYALRQSGSPAKNGPGHPAE
jgi:hypothetical protein